MSKRFHSPFAHDLEKFLSFKRGIGQYSRREEYRLLSFDRFAAQYAVRYHDLRLDHIITQWLARADGRKPTTISADMSVVRQFCLFLRKNDPECFVPGRDLAPRWRKSKFLPYIFPLDEIRLLLQETKTIKKPPFRGFTFRTLLLVLYCTGLRPGEALRLRLRDVDLCARTFFIAEYKGRSRWVPFNNDLAQHIRKYLRSRKKIAPAIGKSPLFIKPNGKGYSAADASVIIRRLLRRIGLKPSKGRCGPRPYDVRHTFAVHRLVRWYEEGVDIQAHLPFLSALMGHENILGTETYLSATPQLLELASHRFAEYLRRKGKES